MFHLILHKNGLIISTDHSRMFGESHIFEVHVFHYTSIKQIAQFILQAHEK